MPTCTNTCQGWAGFWHGFEACGTFPGGCSIRAQCGGFDATVFVGHPHGQTDRWIEVIAEIRPMRTVAVFQAMGLTDKFRYLLCEEGD